MFRRWERVERIAFDAEAHGAKCSLCPLNGKKPVSPEVQGNGIGHPRLVVMGESPGEREDESGRPFVGPSGKRLDKTLAANGLARADVHVTNAVLCKPKEKMTPADWNQAIECCRPRLDAELGSGKTVLACGNKAFQYLTGKAAITNWMGAPLSSIQGHTVLPSIHPAFVLRKPAYIPVFKEFTRRAVALSRGLLPAWQWPTLITKGPYAPHLKVLQTAAALAVDIENFPDSGIIRCIGVGTDKLAVSVPIPPGGDANSEDLRLLRELLAGPATKVLHNSQFDILELKANGWTVNGPIYDTILAHAVVAPQLPHDLSFVAASEYHAPRWKTEFKVVGDDKRKGKGVAAFSGPLDSLLPYNAKDVVMSAMLQKRLQARIAKTHNGQALLDEYHDLNLISMKMKEWGIYTEQANLADHRTNLDTLLVDFKRRFRELVPDEVYDLGANGQNPSVSRLFLETFALPVVSWNKETQSPSLDGKALTSYIGTYATGRSIVAEVARVVLAYRKFSKLKGSYVETLPVDGGGFVHPTWRIFGARTGRWSANDPAMQTIPKEVRYRLPDGKEVVIRLRNLFRARPGYVMVEADYSQLELRIVAMLSGDEKLLDWYSKGYDVHTMNAADIWAKDWGTFSDDKRKKVRDLAKRVVYGLNYGGSAETVWKSLIVDFPGLPLAAIQHVVDGWFRAHPQIQAWQANLVEKAQVDKYIEEPLSGRRQYYHDGKIKPTEVLNFPIQGAAGTLANRAVKAIASQLNWTDEALLAQVHDSTVSEIVEHKQDKLVEIVRSSMEQEVTLNGNVVRFPVDCKVGTNMAELRKVA